MKIVFVTILCVWCAALAQATQPVVAIHDSELTRALGTMPAAPTTPQDTSYEWWKTNWNYFVMPESVEEALRSDGTASAVVSDAMISAGGLLNADGSPKYPIVISLASEAISDDEIAQLTNYVAAGGFLFVGSSAFTRNTNGTTRTDFAFANELGVHMVNPGLTNWAGNSTFSKLSEHRLVSHIPDGVLEWYMPFSAEDIPYGDAPNFAFNTVHLVWQVQAGDATPIAEGDSYPSLLVKQFGKGEFIYYAAMQPLIGHGGNDSGMYAYGIFRNAIEWAFESAKLPIPKLSPWPYPYDAALEIRHDLEAIPGLINQCEASAQFEHTNGASGDYYFCTGELRDDYSYTDQTNEIASLRRAVSLYGATIDSHNGGLTNPYTPSLVTDYWYWHWGPDEALDVDVSALGYANGQDYAFTSISNSYVDVEGWLSGLTNGDGLRHWVSPAFNSTRERSKEILAALGIVTAGEEKLTPFPHWTLSTETSGMHFPFLSLPVSDWYVGSTVSQSLEAGHNAASVQALVDYYYNLGALINLYSHSSSAGGPAPPDATWANNDLEQEYVTYSLNPTLHPRLWPANAGSIYAWWLKRGTATIVPSFTKNGIQSVATFSISGASDPETAVELVVPGPSYSGLQVFTNGVAAGPSSYRTNGQVIKILVGTSVTNAEADYTLSPEALDDFYSVAENTTLTVDAPGVLGNDSASVGVNNLTAVLVSGPADGTLSLSTNGGFTYTPATNYTGLDSFSYVASDGTSDSSVATVSIYVTSSDGALFSDDFTRTNDPGTLAPWIVQDGAWLITGGVLQSTSGPPSYADIYIDGNWTNYSVEGQVAFPAVASVGGGGLGGCLNPATGAHYAAWIYPDGSPWGTPNTLRLIKFWDWTTWGGTPMGAVSLPTVGTNWHTLKLTFQGNEIQVYYDGGLEIDVTDNGFDGRGAYLSGGICVDTYADTSDYTMLVDNVAVTAVTTITNANGPVAVNDSYSVNENTILNVAAPGILANDTPGGGSGGLSAILVTNVTQGTLTLSADGGFIYTPGTNFSGTDSFAYQASDGQTNSATAIVTITVTPSGVVLFSDDFTRTNDPASLLPPWLEYNSDTWSITGGELQSTSGPPEDYAYAYVATNWTDYSVEGRISFPDVLSGGGGLGGRFDPATGAHYGVWVYPDNSPYGVTNVLNLLKFTDWETWTLLGQVSLPSVGTNWHTLKLAFKGDQIGVYYDGDMVLSTNDADSPLVSGGIDLETYENSENYPMSVDDVVVSLLAMNDSYSLTENTSLSVPAPGVLNNDTGVYGTNLTSVLVTGPAHGTLNLTNNGGFIYIPATNYNGYDSFVYQANDDQTNLGTAVVNITVIPLLTVTVGDATRAYGTTNPVFTVSYSGFVNGDDTNVLTGAPLLITSATTNSPVGDYTISVNQETLSATNYNFVFVNGTLTVTQAVLTITSGITANNKPYDGTTAATISSNNVVLNGVLSGDAPNVRLSTNGYSANFASAGVASGIGVTVGGLTLTGAGATNYTLTPPAGLAADITAVAVTITSGITANNKPYDGTTAATISSNNVVLNGVLSGDAPNVRLSTNGYSANFASAGVASGIGVTVGGLTLTGAGATNYTLTPPAGLAADITAVAVTITSGITANNKPYDGTTAATISSNNVVLNGVLSGDAPNVRLSTNGYSANFASAGVASGIGVTVGGLTLTGAGATNYTLTPPAGLAADITAVAVTITSGITANNKPYDGTTAATISSNNVVLNGVLSGDAPNVRLSTNGYSANFASAGVASGIGVTVGGLTLTGAGATNYTLTPPAGLAADITAVAVTITSGITANNKPYDGTTAATISSNNVVLNGVLSGDAPNVRLSTNGYSANFASAGVASGIGVTVGGLTLTGAGATNYTLTPPAGLAADITAVAVTITSGITANNKPYDGTTAATISSNNVVLNGVLSGDAPNVRLSTNGYSANFASAGVASGIGVTVGGLTLTGAGATNYTLTPPAGLAADITAVAVTITSGITANNKPYDGTTAATISSNNVVLNGVLSGDAPNVRLSTNGYSANFASAGVASGIGVTVGGLTLTGAGATNYTLTPPAGLAADITAVAVTITSGITANNKPYDGTTAATISSNNVVLNGVLSGDAPNVRLSTNGYSANFASAGVASGIGVTVGGLTLTGAGATNYTLTPPAGLAADITAVAVTITSGITANNKPYDGTTAATISSNNVVLNGVLSGDAPNVRLSTNGYSANFASAGVASGIGVTVGGLTLTGAGATNYTLTPPAGLAADITAVAVTITSGITANNKPYDGTTAATISSNNVVLNGVLSGDAPNVRLSTNGYSANFASAGVASGIGVTVGGLTLTGAGATNYTLTPPAGLAADITAVAVTITSGITANNKPYDGTTAATISSNNVVLNGVLSGDAPNVRLSTNGYSANFASAGVASGIGVTVGGLTLTGAGATNYTLTPPAGLAADITAVAVTITSGITANNKPYDGTTAATISSNNVVLNGVLSGDAPNVRLSTNGYSANFASAGVASGIGVTVGGLTLTGAGATNYTLTPPAGLAADITAVAVTITSGITANNKPYDGTTAATISSNNVVLNGVLSGDAPNVRLSTNGYSANFASAGVASGIGVTVGGLTLTGAGATNYTLTPPAGLAADITAVAVTITSGITANNKPYDGTTAATISSNNVVLNGVLSGDAPNVRLSTNGYTANFASPNVGAGIVVTVGGLTLTGASATNYTLTPPAGLAADITAVAVTITSGITANNKPYDGTTAATISSNNVVLNGVLSGDAPNVRLSTNGYSANFASAGVASGIGVTVGGLTLTGAGATNYTLTPPAGLAADITAVGVAVTNLQALDKFYDGTTNATLDATHAGLTGVLNGDSVTLVANNAVAYFADKQVGTNKPVTVTGLVLGGASATNYSLAGLTNVVASITPAGLTVTGVTAASRVYDGTTTATLSGTAALNGRVSSDDVSLVAGGVSAAFAGPNVGTGIAVTVSGYAVTGADAGNYTLAQPSGLTADITAKALSLSVPSPVITSLHLTNGVVTIAWNSVAGESYRLQYVNNLNGAAWTDLLPDVVATGSTATQTDTVSGVSQRFYRVRVLTSGITANDKVYDGTTVATISSNGVVLVGVVGGDTVSLSTNGYTANFASPNVGAGIVVTVGGLTLTGASATNYTLTPPAGLAADITAVAVTVSAVDTSRTFGLTNILTASYSGFVHSEGPNVLNGSPSLSTSATANSPPDTYPITISAGTLSATNYTFTFTNGTLTVMALPQLSSVALNENQFVLSWPTIAGQNYQLEYKDNLTAANWTLLGDPHVGTGGSIVISNELGASPQRFFRLLISH